jgi:hypothetical protein
VSNSRLIVDNPAAFTPLPYGLLSVAQMPTISSTHWLNGITYQVSCTNSGDTTYDECINITGGPDNRPPEPSLKDNTTELTLRGATPVTVRVEFDCAPVGMDEARQIAERAFAQTASWQAERAFWTGTADGQQVVFPHLAANAEVTDQTGALLQSVPVTGSATDVVCALGFLEDTLADCYNGVGVIHVTRRTLPVLFAWNLVEARGPQLRTRNGNLVVVGSGYPGTGPAGQVPTACMSWMYATGAVFALASPIRIINGVEAFDRTTNTRKLMAERTYVIGWDCCHAAIETTLNVPVA